MSFIRILAVIFVATLSACDDGGELPARQGEVYLVAPAIVLPENALFCRADANDQVAPCVVFRGDFPTAGRERQARVGGAPFRVIRSELPSPGRFAFFSATTRTSISRTSYSAGTGSLVIDARPNRIFFLDVGLPEAESREIAKAAVSAAYGPAAAELPVDFARIYAIKKLERGGFRLLNVLKPGAR